MPLDTIPQNDETTMTILDFPRLFQRMKIGNYAVPKPNGLIVPEAISRKAQPLEERFGTLLYDKKMQQKSPVSHDEYVAEGFKAVGTFPKPDAEWHRDYPVSTLIFVVKSIQKCSISSYH